MVVAQEFDYKTWARTVVHYPDVEITNGMRLAAMFALPAFRWRYRIVGPDLELYDNANLNYTPKPEGNVLICTGYIDYGLKLHFSPFMTMALNHFRHIPSQYAAHFYLILSILEDINIVEFDPLSIDDLLAH